MKSFRDISAEQIARTDLVSIDSRQSPSKIKAKMEEHDLREIPVVDGKKLKGMISYRELIRKINTDPTNTTAETVMHQPPTAENGMNLIELAQLRRDSGVKRFVLQEGDQLKAVIGEEEMVFALTGGADELRGLQFQDLMNTELIALKEGDKHTTLVEEMRDHNISRIPIVDNQGKLTGIVSSQDALRSMVPREQMTRGDRAGEKDDMSDIPCRELMRPDVLTIQDPKNDLTDVIEQMKRKGAREAILTEGGSPEAILTLRDILDYIATFEETDAVLVNLINVDDNTEKRQIHEKIETAVQGALGRMVTPKEINLHVKKYDEEGSRQKYSIQAKMFSDRGITMVKGHGWNLLDTVDEIIERLKERAKDEKEKERDQAREQEREAKYSDER
jgi:CBS domain-containing protein/ribosome-associated translation inhibitor RaiA